jgi:hypothetical protein
VDITGCLNTSVLDTCVDINAAGEGGRVSFGESVLEPIMNPRRLLFLLLMV